MTNDKIINLDNDEEIQTLKEKIRKLELEHTTRKKWNAYYRKNKTMQGCTDIFGNTISPEKAKVLDAKIKENNLEQKPVPLFILTNGNANLKRYKTRLTDLERIKAVGTQEIANEHFKIVENADLMRLQLFFESKPEEDIRDLLKKHAFRWSYKNLCWQRQLTENAKFSLKNLIEELNNIAKP